MNDKTRAHDNKASEVQPHSATEQSQDAAHESRSQRLQRTLGNRFLARRAAQGLGDREQARLGQAFGADLSGVRLHTDQQAAADANALNASAFTSGQDIYFASNQYQPETPSGQRLLAHEVAHTVQQGMDGSGGGDYVSQPGDAVETQANYAANAAMSGTTVGANALSPAPNMIAREAAPPSGSSTPGGTGSTTGGTTGAPGEPAPGAPAGTPGAPSVDPQSPPDEISLMSPTFQPSPAVAAYLDSAKNDTGDVRVRFGNIAAGAIKIRKRSTKTHEGDALYQTKGKQAIPLTVPAFQPLVNAGVSPVLAVDIDDNQIKGYVTVATSKGVAGSTDALVDWIEKHATEFGWAGIDLSKLPKPKNELADGVLRLQVDNFKFKLGGYAEGTGSFGLANEVLTFNANAAVHVNGITDAQIEISRDEQGGLYAKTEIPVTLANFSGSLIAEYGNGTFNVQGTVKYQAEKFNGEVTLLITDAASARSVALQRLGPEAIAASAETAQGGTGNASKKGPKPGDRAVAGWGILNFAITDWMTGTAQVIIDNEGHITVVGEIRPPAEVILFEQRDYIKELAGLEVRASYGLPVIGNIFVFAGIKVAALAKLGPGKIYNIVLKGTYSTDPKVLQNFSISGSLNISAFAGIRVRAEGGAGIEILDHDIKAGVGLNAIAGVRGYVEATPTIGYREKAAPEEGKKGEYFLHGHMEIAAQPILGLSGDLFVELDSPWWSPAPDKTWTWPIGELEYPLPGQFGIGADVDYVIGSDKLPEIQFGEVAFDKQKFMTDLMNDHVPKGGNKGDEEKKGEWKEGQPAGEGAVDPKLAPGAAAPGAAQPATGQQKPGDGQPIPPEKLQAWSSGLKALGALATQSQSKPLDRAALDGQLAAIKKQYGFSNLRVEHTGEDWLVFPSMSPETPKGVKVEGVESPEGAQGKTAAQRPAWIPAKATDDQVRRILALVERAHTLGAARDQAVSESKIHTLISESANLDASIKLLEDTLKLGEEKAAAQQKAVPGAAPENVAESMGVKPTEQQPFPTQQHHIFSQSERFAARWAALGIDIHRYVVSIDEERHQGEAHAGGMRDRMRGVRIPGLGGGGAFNQEWIDYFAEKDRSGETVTRRGVHQKARNILNKFGLNNMRLHVYNHPDRETSLDEIL